MKDEFNLKQLIALCLVSSLASTIRLLPRYSAYLGGGVSWFSSVAAAPILLLYVYMLSAFLKNRRAGEGTGEMIVRAVGPAAGSILLWIICLISAFICGFFLRSGADRYISSIYPGSTAWPFVAVMFLLALAAALGPVKALLRSAKIFAPILTLVIVAVIALMYADTDLSSLTPVTPDKSGAVLSGSLPILDIGAGTLLFTSFLEGSCEKKQGRAKAFILPVIMYCLLVTAASAAILSDYGAELTSRLSYPFFVMVKDLTLFRTIERLDAFVVALWVFPDFVILAVLLRVSGHCAMLGAGYLTGESGSVKDLSNGRWLILCTAALSLLAAILIPSGEKAIDLISELITPGLTVFLSYIVIPLCLLTGKLRKTI